MIKYHSELVQGTVDWFQARCGLLTASEMKHIITPAKLQYSANEKEKTHLYELAAQRITQHVEPSYEGFHIMRGRGEELDAKILYNERFSPVTDVGFVTNDQWGFTLGYSPDALVGEDGLIEVKSRMPKYQVETITTDAVPQEFMLQIQTGLLVTKRAWCDFISYCGGMPMFVKRVEPLPVMQEKIIEAAMIFHNKLEVLLETYSAMLAGSGFLPTERKDYEDFGV